ncbi:MAG TPA: aspartyl-phosphate phosphatase Spo0E family protein [Clostridia bacterium]|nr:aspartyl-phosphate phosphatase Spo0E family protein [Clostridia bacterium]
MKDINELMNKIEELREKMNNIISTNDNLQDTEIIRISKQLDEHLVGYHRMLKGRIKQHDDR